MKEVDIPTTFAKRLTLAREHQGLNQSELARQMGVVPQSVQQWERGVTRPRSDKLEQLCKVLGVSSHWLLTGTGSSETGGIRALPASHQIPVITWTGLIRGDQEMEAQSYLWVSEGVSDEAYGLVMADNTMEPIIPEKAVMVVDPKHAVEPGNIVVARLDGQRNVAVGRLARYGGQILLRPANPEYKPQPMKRTGELLGVVIEFRVAL